MNATERWQVLLNLTVGFPTKFHQPLIISNKIEEKKCKKPVITLTKQPESLMIEIDSYLT